MGMFDDVVCDMVMPDGLNVREYQTKDLDCCLDNYVITKEGRLIRDFKNDEPRRIDEFFTEDFTGSIEIYSDTKPTVVEEKLVTWVEYELTFENGLLKTIKSIYQDEPVEFKPLEP